MVSFNYNRQMYFVPLIMVLKVKLFSNIVIFV